MKTKLIMLIFLISCLCQAQTALKSDTLKTLILNNGIYNNSICKILYLSIQDSLREHIQIKCNNLILTSILLPITDDEVANFSVDDIVATKRGFKIVINWGGGNFFYGRDFYFTFKNMNFYLDIIELRYYKHEPEKEIKRIKKVFPPIPINKFNIFSYIQNE